MKQLKTQPNNFDLNFPFEGLEHSATIMLLPYRQDTWRNNAIPALIEYANIACEIAKFEHVIIGVSNNVVKNYKTYFKSTDNITFVSIEYNDAWARDNTPCFLKNKDEIVANCFGFNAWGGLVNGLYDDWSLDAQLPLNIAKYLNYNYYLYNDFILEGGSIHTNGNKLMVTTAACLLDKGRNPKYSKNEIEDKLKDTFNQKQILWLEHGIFNDETNEHVDNMLAFASPYHVLLAWTDDKSDIQYEYSKAAFDYLSNVTTWDGKKLQITKVLVPKPIFMSNEESLSIVNDSHSKDRVSGTRLAASYVNFYQGKDFVILPSFGCPEDSIVYDQFSTIFKNKKIIQLKSKEILLGGGNIHCITKEIPLLGGKNES